jgi:hypothetical protein
MRPRRDEAVPERPRRGMGARASRCGRRTRGGGRRLACRSHSLPRPRQRSRNRDGSWVDAEVSRRKAASVSRVPRTRARPRSRWAVGVERSSQRLVEACMPSREILRRAMSQERDDTSNEGGEMVLSTVKIEDFDRFWTTFSTKGAEKRKQHGSKGSYVFRDPDENDRSSGVPQALGSDHLTPNDLEAEGPDDRERPSGPWCRADRDPGAAGTRGAPTEDGRHAAPSGRRRTRTHRAPRGSQWHTRHLQVFRQAPA